jgi:uncharacterized protein with PQ loop repeat
MILFTLKQIFGGALVITSVFDGAKYSIQALKIYKNKSSKNISRRFLNWAIVNDLVKLSYGVITPIDWYIVISSLLAIGCMFHMLYAQYLFYPYKMRGCLYFKKPHIFTYIINSWIPNSYRKRL